MVQLFNKMEMESLQTDRNWMPRMRSLAKALFEKKDVANWVVQHVDFGGPQHVYLYQVVPNALKPQAASRFLAAVQRAPEEVSPDQLMIAASADPGGSKTLLRQFAQRPAMADRVIQRLSRQPELVDREFFAVGLLSADVDTVDLSAKAMLQLDLEATPEEQMSAFRTACRLGWDRKDRSVRNQLVFLLRRAFGDLFDERRDTGKDGYKPDSSDRQDAALDWYRKKLATKYPVEFDRLMKTYDISDLSIRLKRIDWEAGDAKRGGVVFEAMQCAKCHDQGSRLGPQLEGITKRFSRRDLFRSIVSPDEQVPKRYRALIVETIDGQVFKGTVVYESVDGITMLTGNGETVRINRQDMEQRRMSAKSLMPAGLLDTADDEKWADLFAYLSTL